MMNFRAHMGDPEDHLGWPAEGVSALQEVRP